MFKVESAVEGICVDDGSEDADEYGKTICTLSSGWGGVGDF